MPVALLEDAAHPGIIKRCSQLQPALQIVASLHIVAGEQIYPADTSKERILGCPAPDPLHLK